jgi:hypothetical protein
MDITINTPALLFPAISLVMLAYSNRFLALANVVRHLHDRYRLQNESGKPAIHAQIRNLKYRLRLIKNMQILGVLSILLSIVSMYFIYILQMDWARMAFAMSLFFFAASLILSLIELIQSTHSLEIELGDMQGMEDPTLVGYLKKRLNSE